MPRVMLSSIHDQRHGVREDSALQMSTDRGHTIDGDRGSSACEGRGRLALPS